MGSPALLSDFHKRSLFLLSFFFVAFGQPAWNVPFSMVAGCIGYALFWYALLQLPERRFWVTVAWYAAVQAVHLSWLTSTKYMGPLIFLVYAFLLFSMGLQFAFLTKWIRLPLRWPQVLGMAGFWVFMEVAWLLPCTGFPWDPMGLCLAANRFSIQWASVWGIYGLSFWVVLTNLLGLRALLLKTKKNWAIWATMTLFPYAFGAIHQAVWESKLKEGKEISVALVQTALTPFQKDFIHSKEFVPLLVQWDRILTYLRNTGSSQFDLIALPEGALPGGAARVLYSLDVVREFWKAHFGETAEADFPPLVSPYAVKITENRWEVSNAFWMQSLANRYHAEVIAGLEGREEQRKYNAAFHFFPKGQTIDRYEKRILVPMGEYLPLGDWEFFSNFAAHQFGVADSFDAGVRAHVFRGVYPMGISICAEETYSHLIREIRQAGAELFVNISNNAWFPESKLALQHYDHGRLRAAENGVCVLRACNTGVTAAIDSFGNPLHVFPGEKAGVLSLKMPIRFHPTLYVWWGDLTIFLVSIFCFFGLLVDRFWKKKLLEYRTLD
ncbi:MAG: apolipoprotein N-acyltransferase [Verrucomicrobiota bacterium]|nr:apolipoprotein N-acyltransferase [Verrucomicrobiota bacterium]